ncbi:hypothetical protein [Mycolicibacter heraklionensis]|uniref:hypothetical protein n=1 Tax=Mycolicibacter heraklionensis TaxID=512402 RepID=UPI000A7E8B6E|nr:hypothetical protein [Mycolicibacter heraklionensis]
MTDCRELGPTSWCAAGRHDRCEHRPGGAQHGGVWLPGGYVSMPPMRGRTGTDPYPDTNVAVVDRIVHPSRTYHCPCDCHQQEPTGQLELFGAAS